MHRAGQVGNVSVGLQLLVTLTVTSRFCISKYFNVWTIVIELTMSISMVVTSCVIAELRTVVVMNIGMLIKDISHIVPLSYNTCVFWRTYNIVAINFLRNIFTCASGFHPVLHRAANLGKYLIRCRASQSSTSQRNKLDSGKARNCIKTTVQWQAQIRTKFACIVGDGLCRCWINSITWLVF